MLNDNNYNISELKKLSKARFFEVYLGKMPDIELVWDWLHGSEVEKEVKKPKKK